METADVLARVLLALVFLAAGSAKLADLSGARKFLADSGVPPRFARPLGLCLPLWEMALGVALFPSVTAWPAGIGALVLLVVFIAGIVSNLALGRAPDFYLCGQLHVAPVGLKAIACNAVCCAIATVIIRHGAEQPSLAGMKLKIAGVTVPLFLLIAVVSMFVSLVRQNGRMHSRIEALENQLAPKPGLPVGNFKGQKTLFLFWNPDCGFCFKLLDKVKAWESAQPKLGARLVIVSSGTIEQTQAQGFRSAIVHGIGTEQTPSALLIDEDGTVISAMAVGADEVLGLMRAQP
jgi:uncharacterized membrane protein YphA (DoxX/SURF4 family)/thiol-disulfide isomerase/thioredoxin